MNALRLSLCAAFAIGSAGVSPARASDQPSLAAQNRSAKSMLSRLREPKAQRRPSEQRQIVRLFNTATKTGLAVGKGVPQWREMRSRIARAVRDVRRGKGHMTFDKENGVAIIGGEGLPEFTTYAGSRTLSVRAFPPAQYKRVEPKGLERLWSNTKIVKHRPPADLWLSVSLPREQ